MTPNHSRTVTDPIPFTPPPPPAPHTLADVPTSNVEWLWPGRIPIGKVTLLVGDPGVGKSLLALDVAARTTTAAPWPDAPSPKLAPRYSQLATHPSPNPKSKTQNPKSHPSSVLLLSAEDDLADTIRPRLEAAGADCSRIIAIPPGRSPEDLQGLFTNDTEIPDLRPHALRPPPLRPFDLRHDVPLLESFFLSRSNCRLIVIDPLSAYLGAGGETSNAEVRRRLTTLAALAARRRLAVLAISHLRKQRGAALYRAIGSLAFVAAARAAWLVAKDPTDDRRRLMHPVKNNLGALEGGLSFTIAPAAPDRPPVVHWSTNPLVLSADDALRPTRPPQARPSFERDDAARWLRVTLADGAKPSAELQRDAVAHGLELPTVRRAFRQLGGEAVRVGYGPAGQWYWRLPGTADPPAQAG